ncbi:MAG: ABC transporter substrate-binding protein [Terracidiphilus sp.]
MLRRFVISFFLVFGCISAWGRTRPHYGGTLRVEVAGDPWGESKNNPDGIARHLVLDGLTSLDADGNVRPALATDWQSADNNHRWEFTLRPGVHFHDGSPLTSTAVVMSLNLSCTENCPWTTVHAVGFQVVFAGDSPMPNLPALLAGDAYLIALTRTANGQAPASPTGTGAFQYTSYSNGVLVLTANDNCWQGRPCLDAIAISANRAIRDQWLDLSVGRTDVAEVPPQQLRQAQQQRLTVVVSPSVDLLALQVSDSGALVNPVLRAAIARAVDRGALFNVIFQKQGEITAGLLPQTLTGYAFLFPTDRDVNKANELRGGLTPPPLTLAADGNPTMQLAAQRIALNLHEAGLNVQVVNARNAPHPDLALRTLPLVGADPAAALETLLRAAGENVPVLGQNPAALFRAEHDVLDLNTLVPLLDLPRAYAISGRVRDLRLRADGAPDLAGVSLEGAP